MSHRIYMAIYLGRTCRYNYTYSVPGFYRLGYLYLTKTPKGIQWCRSMVSNDGALFSHGKIRGTEILSVESLPR